MDEIILHGLKAALLAELAPNDQVFVEQIEFLPNGGRVTVSSPNPFIQQNISRFRTQIVQHIHLLLGDCVEIDFTVDKRAPAARNRTAPKPVQMVIPQQPGSQGIGLNPRYTFEDFVVGKSNSFAYQAALAVSDQAIKSYNPLFLHADIGLGKSHIAHAIGNRNLSTRAGSRARYLSALDFSQDYVSAVRNNSVDTFRRTYRKDLDLLFLDDIHLLQNKEKTQIEFSALMDDLVAAGVQVVLSGYRSPSSMPHMDKGLASRISSGLVIEMKRPDQNTRAAIVSAKARKEGIELGGDVVDFIAGYINSNIRELESAVLNIVAMGSLMKREITLDMAKEVLGGAVKGKQARDIPFIQDIVSLNFGIGKDQLITSSRKKAIQHPRQIAIYLSRKYTDETLESIGNAFGRKHSSIIAYSGESGHLL